MFVTRDKGLRRCGRCGQLKPEEEFNWRRVGRGQRDNYCRPCRSEYKKEHYARNRARYIENAIRRRRQIARERTELVLGLVAGRPCADCGETDPLVLEFDHLHDKKFSVSQGLRDRSWDTVLAEIDKCDVVCANCHRRRTILRGGHLRAAVAQR